jgi:hypothetical protein
LRHVKENRDVEQPLLRRTGNHRSYRQSHDRDSPLDDFGFRGRSDEGGWAVGASQQINQTGPIAPYWVKLTRTGSTFTAQRSADGVTWVNITNDPAASSVDIPMASNAYIGLAVTSHNTSMQTSGEFSNVAMTGSVTGQWQNIAIGVAQPSNDATPLYVVVEDKTGHKKTVVHPDPEATVTVAWQPWRIGLSDLSSAGVNLAAVKNRSSRGRPVASVTNAIRRDSSAWAQLPIMCAFGKLAQISLDSGDATS